MEVRKRTGRLLIGNLLETSLSGSGVCFNDFLPKILISPVANDTILLCKNNFGYTFIINFVLSCMDMPQYHIFVIAGLIKNPIQF